MIPFKLWCRPQYRNQYQERAAIPFFTYILECSNGTLYTGWTCDLARRVDQHNAGKGAKYTRSLRPVRLAVSWEFSSKVQAMHYEWQIKRMPRVHKLALIKNPEQLPLEMASKIIAL